MTSVIKSNYWYDKNVLHSTKPKWKCFGEIETFELKLLNQENTLWLLQSRIPVVAVAIHIQQQVVVLQE